MFKSKEAFEISSQSLSLNSPPIYRITTAGVMKLFALLNLVCKVRHVRRLFCLTCITILQDFNMRTL